MMEDRPAWFDEELVSHLPKLRAFAMSKAKNVAKAEDLVQTAVMRALRSHSSFQKGSNMGAWLFTILRNEWLSIGRRSSRIVYSDDPEATASHTLSVPEGQSWALDLKTMMSRIRRLPAIQRNSILLCGLERLSYEEAANILKVPIGTVKSNVSRVRIILGIEPPPQDEELEASEDLSAVKGRSLSLYKSGKSIGEIAAAVGLTRREVMEMVAGYRR